MKNEIVGVLTSSIFGVTTSFLVPKLSIWLVRSLSHDRSSIPIDQSKFIKKERHVVSHPCHGPSLFSKLCCFPS